MPQGFDLYLLTEINKSSVSLVGMVLGKFS